MHVIIYIIDIFAESRCAIVGRNISFNQKCQIGFELELWIHNIVVSLFLLNPCIIFGQFEKYLARK